MGRRRRRGGSSGSSRTIRASAWRATPTRGPRGARRGPPAWDPAPDAGGGSGRLSTLLVGASQIVTCRGPARARRGRELADLEVLRDAAVLIEGERIAAVGRYKDLRLAAGDVQRGGEVVEVAGVLFPGFVDCPTHAVFGAPRPDDQERR